MSLVLIISVGMLMAISNYQTILLVLSELIGGFAVPGKALAMNMFKAYGTMTIIQAVGFVQDLKLGHYAKISPRTMFRAQIMPTFLSLAIVSYPHIYHS